MQSIGHHDGAASYQVDHAFLSLNFKATFMIMSNFLNISSKILLVCLLFSMTIVGDAIAAEDEDSLIPDFIIGPGDVLEISHWQNAQLTKQLVVLPDGKFSFPLIGEIVAGGKTVKQLKAELEERISRYVPDPVLSVVVLQVNGFSIYVIGKVNRPSVYALNSNVNVLQALAMAGGLNSFAKKGKIKIFRTEGSETIIFPFDYDDVADGENLETNILLRRGDVIVVP